MKALIVLGGEAPGEELLQECMRQADWSIAADSGLAAFDACGLEPDVIVGDMDSVAPEVLERFKDRVSIERLPCIKDDTDGVHALDAAIREGASEIMLLGALGGRPDHLLANLMLLVRAARKGVQATIRSESISVCRVPGQMVLRGAAGRTVSLLPLGQAEGITLKGFCYPMENGRMDSTYPLGISNVVTEDPAEVRVGRGDLLLFRFMAS